MSVHKNLASALVAALTDVSVVEKGRKANAGSYSYDYADIADLVLLTRPALAEHGVVALTPVHDHGTGLACTVVLLHASGDRLDFGPFPFPHGKDAQATGSMVTYHRRYALLSALGMAAADDDGAAAQPRQAGRSTADDGPGPKGEPPEPHRKIPDGWDSLEAWDDAANTYAEALAALPDTVRTNVKAAKKERGIGWPVSPAEMTELLTLLESYVVKPEAETADLEAPF